MASRASTGAPLLREGIPVIVLDGGVARTVASLQSTVARTLSAQLVQQGGELIFTLSDLTTEDDLLLLRHTLTAATYGTLRDAQALRVDFSGFPRQLAELLRRPTADSAFIAVLTMGANTAADGSAGGRFEIVQLSQFRLLAHIELHVERATPAELLEALQRCVRESISEVETMRRVEGELKNELITTQTTLREAEGRCSEIDTLRTVANNVDAAMADADTSRENLEIARRELAAAGSEAEELRARVDELERLRRISEDRMGRITNERDDYRTRADGLATAQNAVSELAGEIRAANNTIERLRRELRTTRDRDRVRNMVMEKQETRIGELEAKMDDLNRANSKLTGSNESIARERDSARRKLQAAQRAAERTAVALATNRECIAFLNGELNRTEVLLGTPTPEILKTPTRRNSGNNNNRNNNNNMAEKRSSGGTQPTRRTGGVSATGATTAVSS